MVEIWHNPGCSKSRQALALLQERGVEPRVVKYLEEPPTRERLVEVLALLGLEPSELVRKQEKAFAELGLGSVTDRDRFIAAMVDHPILIERPVVIASNRAVVGRPPERVLELV
jgi:arsenate reductase (glutaredoxin)